MARTLVLGRSGVGKSWFGGWLLERIIPRFDLGVHFDIEDEERGLSCEGGLLTSLYIDKEMWDGENVGALIKRCLRDYSHLRIIPEGMTQEEERELCSLTASVVMEIAENTDNSLFFSIDETHIVAPQGKLSDELSRVATGGRKHGVEWLMTTQRPQLIDKTILTQTDYFVSFQLKDRDVGKVQDSVGFDAERLKSLPKRQFIIESLDEGKVAEVNTETLERHHPHLAADDGLADEPLDALL